MSWDIKEKSTMGDIQYINASYTTSINTSDTSTNINPFNVIGYTKGSVAYNVEGIGANTTNVIIKLQGSNDGTNYFDFNSSSTHTTTGIGNVSWNIPSKLMRINASITKSSGSVAGNTTIGGLDIVGTAGGGGGDESNVTSSSTITSAPGGTNKQIQFNDNGTSGGAFGALYDKTVNSNAGQLQLTEGTVSLPVISFSDGTHPAGNYDTGIYRPSADQIGFTIAGTQKANISSSHFSVDGGTSTDPSINFGIVPDANTGMFQIDSDTIGFSTGGVEKVSIYSADSGDFIEGLNIGLTSNIAGIRRLSASGTNSWEDGHLGNASGLVFTATDFVNGGGPRTLNTDVFYGQGRTSFRLCAQSSQDILLVAQKIIPKGFQIIADASFTVFTETNQSVVYTVQSGNIDSGLTSSATTRFNATANTNIPLTLTAGGPDVGDGVNSITIAVDVGAIWTILNGVIGATINMERV